MTQRAVVEQLLRQDGVVSARTLTYTLGITRGAAIIHTLRRAGWDIATEEAPGKMAVYRLRRAAVRPQPLPPELCHECGLDYPGHWQRTYTWPHNWSFG